jgi:PKD repeat protein
MTYEWWSDDLNLANTNESRLNIGSDTINKYLGDTHTIHLMVYDDRGCMNADSIRFFTFPNPNIGIKMLKSSPNICLGDAISLIDTIGGNSNGEYNWEFIQDGYFETNINPSYIYDGIEGAKDVYVQFTDTNGCLADSTIQFTVHPLPNPSFVVDLNSCIGDELFINNQSDLKIDKVGDAISTYIWDLGNGNQITVDPYSVISDSNLYYISDIIRNTSGIPGPDLSYRYNETGNYNISLYAETFSGCKGDTIISTNVRDSVHVDFDVSTFTNVCFGQESKFFPQSNTSDTNIVASYEWYLNDTLIVANNLNDTIKYTFDSPGIYDVVLKAISKYGCTKSISKEIEIYQSPVAFFITKPVCENTVSVFNSDGSDLTTNNYTWNLPDTTIYSNSGELVNYLFDNKGEFPVNLRVEHANGCASEYVDTAIVLSNPNSSLQVNNACFNTQNDDTLILNTSVNTYPTIYNWEFGDGSSSELVQPTKRYDSSGNYIVQLTSTNKYIVDSKEYSCLSKDQDTIEIYKVASASFSIDEHTNVCEGLASSFLATELKNSSEVDFYQWILDTDTTISSPTPDQVDYQFAKSGDYNVQLKTVTNNACLDSVSKVVTIYEIPAVKLISDSVCLGGDLVFSVKDDIQAPEIDYKWYFDGISIGEGTFANINSSQEGIHEIVLRAESVNGCTNYDTSSAVVFSLPDEQFQSEINVCSDTFQLVGTDSNSNYLWNNTFSENIYTVKNDEICTVRVTDKLTGCFINEWIQVELNKPLNVYLGNDTSVCNDIILDAGYFGQTAEYIWTSGETGRYKTATSSGDFLVTVSQGGCSSSDNIHVDVNNSPSLELGDNLEVCEGESVILDAEINNSLSYLWSTGENGPQINISTKNAGVFNYKVTVTDANNCLVSDQVSVTINPLPKVNLGNDIDVCQNEELVLNATTLSALSYSWNTGESSSIIYPKEQSNTIESKIFSVEVTNKFTCVDQDSILVNFFPVPSITLPDEMLACGNELVELSAYNQDIITYNWNNGSLDSVLIIDPMLDGDGTYYAILENKYNCISKTNNSSVLFKSIPEAILPEFVTGCNSIEVNAGNFGAEFLWSDNVTNQKREIFQTGEYVVTITNRSSCAITDTVNVIVNYVTKPYLGPDVELCTNDTKVIRTGIHDSEYSFFWNGYSTGDTMTVATPGTYIVKAIHNNGCVESDTINVISRPLPFLDLGEDTYKCSDDNIILDAGKDGFDYFWQSSLGIESNERLFEVTDTGKYWVQVTNNYNCVSSDTILIRSTSLSIDPMFVTNSKLIAGDSVLFVDMSYPEPINWLWEFGDLQQSVLQNPVHVYYGKGEYQVNLHVSNSVCSASIIKIIEVEQNSKDGQDEENEEFFGDKHIEIQSVKIYPNPTNGNLTIEAELSHRTNANIYIFDLMGRLIDIRKYSNVDRLYEYLDIQGVSSGIYIVKIFAGTDHKTYKIIKQ